MDLLDDKLVDLHVSSLIDDVVAMSSYSKSIQVAPYVWERRLL